MIIAIATHLFLVFTILTTAALMVPLVPLTSQWYQLVVVQSGSMAPSLEVGSLALYKEATMYGPDDVIAYKYGDGADTRIVLHRIIQKRTVAGEVSYVTKGDALAENTVSHISAAQVQGKVVGSIPKIGFLISWLQTPKGIVVVMFVPLCLLLISQLTRWP